MKLQLIYRSYRMIINQVNGPEEMTELYEDLVGEGYLKYRMLTDLDRSVMKIRMDKINKWFSQILVHFSVVIYTEK